MSDRWKAQDYADYQSRRNRPVSTARAMDRFVRAIVKHDYKADFEQELKLLGIQVEPEFYFARPRKFRADWRVQGTNILIDYEGGLFMKGKGGHSSVSGIHRDIEKANIAAIGGWTVIRITPKHVVSGQASRWVEQAIGAKK